MRLAILTVSDAGSRGERQDTSGDAIAAWAEGRGYRLAARELVPDETTRIAATIAAWADSDAADLVLTTGGTGLTPTDRTPEAVRPLLDREVPGIAEAIRARGVAAGVPTAMLSRGLAGVAGQCLVVTLPGSRGGVRDALDVLEPVLRHAVEQVVGSDHP
jgi:molybdenum cofactor synthesis domain-containing protein